MAALFYRYISSVITFIIPLQRHESSVIDGYKTCTAIAVYLEYCYASLHAGKRKNGLACGKAHFLEAKTDKGMENARFHSCTTASIFFPLFLSISRFCWEKKANQLSSPRSSKISCTSI
jgi:hypothetical protein